MEIVVDAPRTGRAVSVTTENNHLATDQRPWRPT